MSDTTRTVPPVKYDPAVARQTADDVQAYGYAERERLERELAAAKSKISELDALLCTEKHLDDEAYNREYELKQQLAAAHDREKRLNEVHIELIGKHEALKAECAKLSEELERKNEMVLRISDNTVRNRALITIELTTSLRDLLAAIDDWESFNMAYSAYPPNKLDSLILSTAAKVRGAMVVMI